MTWSPDSWRAKPLRQDPGYPDPKAAAAVAATLANKPGLVPLSGVLQLKKRLAQVAAGTGFLLQGGDCGESFDDRPGAATATARLLGQMAGRLEAPAGPVVSVARLGGQYAKPRSEDVERRGAERLPNYRGDIVNGGAFSVEARTPDPERMLTAYARAQDTVSALAGGVFTSHEALLLPFEQALLRNENGVWYSSSAHMLWLGYRTRFADGAHAEFLRGIANPLGVKVGPESSPEDLLRLLALLNPDNEAGKITLVCRLGLDTVGQLLPRLVRAVEGEGFSVLWSCDPMHGNTRRNADGLKVRSLDRLLAEALSFVALLRAEGVRPGGIHLELTGEDITECGEGAAEVASRTRNHTHCDPRLNAAQSLSLASALAAELARAGEPARAQA
jgi:3-deoxy-7-phosphoheptulonate synthase